MPIRTYLSRRTLQSYIHYDGRTGAMHWLVDRGRVVRAGDKAGSVDPKTGFVTIVIEGRTYLAHRLVWLYVTGEYPPGRLTFIDGNRANLRWRNIALEEAVLSRTPSAIYQRDLRKRRRLLIDSGSLRLIPAGQK